LLAARNAHSPSEYQAVSARVLLELQHRNLEILEYLSRAVEISVG
jgi:hypothetical protein